MVGACPTNGGFQNPPTGHAVGTERIQEEAGTAKGELDGHREAQPEEHGHQLGAWEEAGELAGDRTEWRQRVAQCIYDAG